MALQLSSFECGPFTVPAAPPGGTPGIVAFEISSNGGPFCIVGFKIDPAVSSPQPLGLVQIGLSRINGEGMTAALFEIANGHEVAPQDLVISYGSVLSSAYSLSFQATQWPAASGTGAELNLYGTITYLADSSATLFAKVTPP
jgi:hypothetical protein